MAAPEPILKALAQLEARLFERIDARLAEQIGALRLDMNGNFDAVHRRLDRLLEGRLTAR
jgi:hypothetical protein